MIVSLRDGQSVVRTIVALSLHTRWVPSLSFIKVVIVLDGVDPRVVPIPNTFSSRVVRPSLGTTPEHTVCFSRAVT